MKRARDESAVAIAFSLRIEDRVMLACVSCTQTTFGRTFGRVPPFVSAFPDEWTVLGFDEQLQRYNGRCPRCPAP